MGPLLVEKILNDNKAIDIVSIDLRYLFIDNHSYYGIYYHL